MHSCRPQSGAATSRAARRRGSVFVEYILLVTLVGIGVIVGLATVRTALHNELLDLANAISNIVG